MATSENVIVHEQCDVDIEFDWRRLRHMMILADVTDDIILDLCFLHQSNTSLDEGA